MSGAPSFAARKVGIFLPQTVLESSGQSEMYPACPDLVALHSSLCGGLQNLNLPMWFLHPVRFAGTFQRSPSIPFSLSHLVIILDI